MQLLRQEHRHHSDHGWLQSHASLSYADGKSVNQTQFSSLWVVNEDIVSPKSGFPTHFHNEFEIFTYVVSGNLTHRDTIPGSQAEHLRRGHVQFTTAGTGIRHSEQNEHDADDLHFLQIWVKPWKSRLKPRYHVQHFHDAAKRQGFTMIISPLAAGLGATDSAEEEAQPIVPDTIPIHADCFVGAALVPQGSSLAWTAGAGLAKTETRKIFLHVVMKENSVVLVKDGTQKVTLNGGSGVFVEDIGTGGQVSVLGVGDAEAEIVVLDMS